MDVRRENNLVSIDAPSRTMVGLFCVISGFALGVIADAALQPQDRLAIPCTEQIDGAGQAQLRPPQNPPRLD